MPERLDSADAADVHALVALNNSVCRSDSGLDDYAMTVEEALPRWRTNSDVTTRIFVARREARIVGAVVLCWGVAEPTSVEADLMVLPECWGHGVEQALLDLAEAEVRALDRRVIQAWTLHRTDPGSSPFTPSTGHGRVSASPHARLLAENGFTLAQVERSSVFDLRADPAPIGRMLTAALATAGGDYRLVEWTLPTPSEHRDGYAWALSRMSTDAPSGGLDVDEEAWDAARIIRRDARFADGGQTVSVVAAVHVPTGSLAAFNELVIGADLAGVTHQYSTLVLKEHRGHRLGQAVKCANILRWRGIAPDSTHISTFNAEENRPMLDINEAMGFRPVSYAGAWQKTLS